MPTKLTRSILAALFLTLFCGPVVLAQSPDQDAHAADVLKKARTALGGEAALNAIGSLSASGDFRFGSGEAVESGEVRLEILLPDRLIRVMKWSPMQAMNVNTTEAMNGDQIWTGSKANQHNQPIGLGTIGIGGRGRGGRRPTAGGDEGGGPNEPAPRLEDGMNDQQIRSYFSCLIMALLLRSPDLTPGKFGYQGEANIEGAKADLLKITLKDGTVVRLAINQETHLPIMAGYSVPGHDSLVSGGRPRRKKHGEGDEAAVRGPEVTEVEVYFTEYKAIAENKTGNIWLPHQITRTSSGLTVEDMHIKIFHLNPHLDEKQFEQKR